MQPVLYAVLALVTLVTIIAAVFAIQEEPVAQTPTPEVTLDLTLEQSNLRAVEEAIAEQRMIEAAYEKEYGEYSDSNPMLEYWKRAQLQQALP